MLSKTKTETYKEKLEGEKTRLLEEIKTDKSMLDFGGDIDHGDEETDEAEELGNELAIENVLKRRIAEIDLALKRAKEGTYGKCVQCGAEISEKILNIAPESKLCEKCKRKQ